MCCSIGVISRVIEKGNPWETGCIESFNERLRDELRNGGVFYSLREAQVVVEQ
jgi:hypothetical protein